MADKIQKFDEFSLDQDIIIYLERLEQFFAANKVTEEVQFQSCSNFPPIRQVVERDNGFGGQSSKAANKSWPKMNHVTEQKQRNKPNMQRMSTGARNKESGKMAIDAKPRMAAILVQMSIQISNNGCTI